MVDLVLQDPRAQPAGVDRQGLAVDGTRLDLDPCGARDRGEHARDRQAAFLSRHLAAAIDDRRIQKGLNFSAVLVGDDDEPKRNSHLRRREADADLVVHRLGHVGDDRADLRRHLADGRGVASERRIAVFPDL